jgi:probable F420-dependent oxidoreductase
MGKLAEDLVGYGFDGVAVTETSRSAYLSSAAMALGTPDLHICTGVAVAFPRSPMVTAGAAWELAELTKGHFRLGLGTQVRAHVKRRYGAEFDPPGPRMEEYVRALRAIFDAFAGNSRLDFSGEHWSMNLLPPTWAPGGGHSEDGVIVPPPIDVAAVNPWMLRMAGRVADGVHVHPLNNPAYLDTVSAEVAAGEREAKRGSGEVKLLIPCFTVVGDTEEERSKWRELARTQVGFYGSTPNYSFIFDQIGHEGVGEGLNAANRNGDFAQMTRLVSDEVLGHFVVESGWDDLAAALVDRFGGRAERVILYFANPVMADGESMRKFGAVARQVAALAGQADESGGTDG